MMSQDGPDGSARDMEPNSAKNESTWSADLKDIVKLAGPAILQLSFQQAVIVCNQSFAGHLGPDELAAAAIAVTWFNLMWFFIIGASSALDTLASQAYGAGDRSGVISWSISSAVVLSIMAVPMAVALYMADSVAVVIFQQPDHIAELVGVYCRGILPGLWPFVWSLIMMKALQSQNIMWAPCIITVLMFGINIVVNLVFIKLGGFTGAAYAQSASRIVLLLLLIGYICTIGRSCIQFEREAWILDDADQVESNQLQEPLATGKNLSEDNVPFAHPSLKQVMKDGFELNRLAAFLRLGTAGGLMMAADASSFDITTAMAGFIGVEEVGAHTSLLTIIEFIFTSFPYGIATAATIRVGNRLGADNARSAKQSAYLCLAGCGCFNITIMVLFFVFGKYVGYIFTDDPTVVSIVARLSILAGLYQIPDCIYGTASGILRGTGRQASLMWTNLLGFWGVGMPLCYYLAFKRQMGVEGLWIGLVAGLSTSALLVLIMLLCLDWEKEAEQAKQFASLANEEEALEEQEEAGGDQFSDALSLPPSPTLRHISIDRGETSAPQQEGSPTRRRPRSAPIEASSRPQTPRQHPVGSFTGSYTRKGNMHL